MAGAAAVGVITSVSALNLHFRANRKSGWGALVSPARRLNFGLSVTCSSLIESNAALLDAAAKHTVDKFIKNGMVAGLGSGLASRMAVQYLGRQLRLGAVKHIVGIPTSVGSASEAAKAGIPLDQYEVVLKCARFLSIQLLGCILNGFIDFAFNDADIIEEGTLISVIGRRRLQGEESIIQEKSILKAAENLVFIVTEKQYKGGLEGSIPVLIKSYNWMETAEEIDDLFLGDAEVWRRPSIGHASPLGGDFPLITREGHNVLDVIFTSPILSLAEIAKSLDNIDGVVDHGVISKIPCTAVVASEDGIFIVENSPKKAEKGI